MSNGLKVSESSTSDRRRNSKKASCMSKATTNGSATIKKTSTDHSLSTINGTQPATPPQIPGNIATESLTAKLINHICEGLFPWSLEPGVVIGRNDSSPQPFSAGIVGFDAGNEVLLVDVSHGSTRMEVLSETLRKVEERGGRMLARLERESHEGISASYVSDGEDESDTVPADACRNDGTDDSMENGEESDAEPVFGPRIVPQVQNVTGKRKASNPDLKRDAKKSKNISMGADGERSRNAGFLSRFFKSYTA